MGLRRRSLGVTAPPTAAARALTGGCSDASSKSVFGAQQVRIGESAAVGAPHAEPDDIRFGLYGYLPDDRIAGAAVWVSRD